jgi:hypothetical protein
MIDMDCPLTENPVDHHHFLSALIADYGIQHSAAFVFSHDLTTFF